MLQIRNTFMGELDNLLGGRKNELYGGQDGETSSCHSYPLSEDLASSACVCEHVVNAMNATSVT